MDTALFLQDIVKTLKFDQSLEETVKFLDSISERDLTFFENNDFTEDSYLGEERVSGEVVGVNSHVQQGVICFNVDKMMRTTQVTKNIETSPSRSQHMDTSPSSVTQDSMIQEEIFSESKSEFQAELSCHVCGKPALKYSSYGGIACTSCRSFFRRSAREDNYVKYKCAGTGQCCDGGSVASGRSKRCQLCRFNKCLEIGMRVTWVLSTEERNRRFQGKRQSSSAPLIKPLVTNFTIEEQLVIQDINNKFEIPWLEHFFLFDRAAAVNWIEYTFCNKDLDLRTWKVLGDSLLNNFSEILMPKFQEICPSVPSSEFARLWLQSNNRINFFRSCFAIKLPSTQGDQGIKPYYSSLENQMPIFLERKRDFLNEEIFETVSRIENYNENSIRVAPFTSVYSDDISSEGILRLMTKVQRWPLASDGTCIPHLISLMSVILVFSMVQTKNITINKMIEDSQLKFSLMLQRYLRFHLLHEREANEKFLEAMLLIADVKEATETRTQPADYHY